MTDIPAWAFKRAAELSKDEEPRIHWAGDKAAVYASMGAFARYIAEHEQPPVDPLLVEAREIVAKYYDDEGQPNHAQAIRAGNWNETGLVKSALAALRRGIELAKEGAA